MLLEGFSNVLPFPPQHLSRQDRTLIGEWWFGAAPLGVANVHVRHDVQDDHARSAGDRIAIQFRRGVADGHPVMIQRAAGKRVWVTSLLQVGPDGAVTLPLKSGDAVRRDRTLRDALNAVRPVLPDVACEVFDYQAARRERSRVMQRGSAA